MASWSACTSARRNFTDLNAVISQQELAETAAHYKKLAGFDPVLLNERESYTP